MWGNLIFMTVADGIMAVLFPGSVYFHIPFTSTTLLLTNGWTFLVQIQVSGCGCGSSVWGFKNVET